MADPLTLTLTIVSIISSATSFTATTSALSRRVKKTDSEIQSQLHDIEVMCEVLEECQGIIEKSQNVKIPLSVERTLDICLIRYKELMEILERARVQRLHPGSTFSSFARWTKQLATENERKTAFSAFRNAVLLLRDLCTDIRIRQQLVNMSAGLAELMVDYSGDQEPVHTRSAQPGHIRIGEQEEQHSMVDTAYAPSTDLVNTMERRNLVGNALKDLIKQNFTRNATIVVDNGVGTFPERLQYVHVRAKMDTGCNDNLITMELVEKAGIDSSLLNVIPEDQAVDLQGLDSAKCTPLYEIDLTWYQDGDMKMRDSRFYVVKEGPFDMLIGSRRFAQDLGSDGNPSLILAKRRKKKAEREKEKAEHEKYLQQERDEEIREREDRARSAQTPAQQFQPLNQVQQSPLLICQNPGQSTTQQSLQASSGASQQLTQAPTRVTSL